jgi:hypothetical protein
MSTRRPGSRTFLSEAMRTLVFAARCELVQTTGNANIATSVTQAHFPARTALWKYRVGSASDRNVRDPICGHARVRTRSQALLGNAAPEALLHNTATNTSVVRRDFQPREISLGSAPETIMPAERSSGDCIPKQSLGTRKGLGVARKHHGRSRTSKSGLLQDLLTGRVRVTP